MSRFFHALRVPDSSWRYPEQPATGTEMKTKTAKHSKLWRRRSGGFAAPAGQQPTHAREGASVPAIIASLFAKLDLERRARVLGRLLGAVGPLALVVVVGGAFAKYLRDARLPEMPIALEDAARATASQVHELARYAEQSNPRLVDGLLALLLHEGITTAALAALR
jgi:hypothetical protein